MHYEFSDKIIPGKQGIEIVCTATFEHNGKEESVVVAEHHYDKDKATIELHAGLMRQVQEAVKTWKEQNA